MNTTQQGQADKLLCFIALMTKAREAMGQRGRVFVEQHFDERVVIGRYLAVVAEIDAIRLARVAQLGAKPAG